MAIKVRSAAASADRFVQQAGQAQQTYVDGVKNSGDDWLRETIAGKTNWQTGVTQAAARGAFEKGVQNSGAKYFQDRAAQLGGTRYATGVAASKQNYIDGVTPFNAAIANATLPPRGPRGSAQNMQRAAEMAQILNTVRNRGNA
jgi:hypothetical protein